MAEASWWKNAWSEAPGKRIKLAAAEPAGFIELIAPGDQKIPRVLSGTIRGKLGNKVVAVLPPHALPPHHAH
eukprot:10901710-Prorocentrum_lima.AAC.1